MATEHPQQQRRGQGVTINFADKLNHIAGHWRPHAVADMNDYQFKLVRVQGDFVWHSHADTDEAFVVIDGVLRIDLKDRSIELRAGEMAVIPKGLEHKPYAASEVKLLLIEPAGVPNTGDALAGDRTAEDGLWI